MTDWDYRLTRIYGGPIAIRKVFYDGDEIDGWITEPVALGYFYDESDARASLGLIMTAFDKPVLELP